MILQNYLSTSKPYRNRASRKSLIVGFLASTSLTIPAMAGQALPTGANVAAGSVAVSQSDTTMTVKQGSDRAIVNWNDFSVGAGHNVNFVQPNASSAILNRVTGATTSTIAGAISANGQVYLVNPNGIAITPTGTVNVGSGFVASTLDISNEDFLKGNLNFNGNGASAGVSNEGILTVGRGGYAALIGGTVRNDGLIAVPMGKVGLGSGEQATLDLSADGFLQVAVPTKDGAEGQGALIENRGTVSASGGTVVMRAATARQAARQAINLSGVVEANSVSGQNGEIVIGGGDGGDVEVSGQIRAVADAGQGKGGSATVTGQSVKLAGALVDVSGVSGGGSVKIGGDRQGSGETQRAQTTSVDKNTVIRAGATSSGDGGTVVVWSDDLTTFNGLITARGAGAGDGGNAEVSGKDVLSYAGTVDLSADRGDFGMLLLDPHNLTISNGADSGVSGFSANADDSILNVATLTNALATANVIVSTGSASSAGSQDGDITIAAPIAWSANTRLGFEAAGNVIFNAAVTATGDEAGLFIEYGAGKGYTVNAPITLSGASALLNIGVVGALQSYTLIHDMAALDAIDATGLSGYYALAQSLDASGTTYGQAVIGSITGTSFGGTFAGLGNTISNLTISSTFANVGLFGQIGAGSLVRDLGLVGGSVSGVGNVGALVGINRGTISRSYATGTVQGTSSYVGGLVGFDEATGTITQSYATGSVTNVGNYVGGLVGDLDGGSVTLSYATGSVQGNNYLGGLIGFADSGSSVSQSYATGSVSGTGADFGGLIGQNRGSVSETYATGHVTGGTVIGGLFGYTSGTATNSYFDADTTGQTSGVGLGPATGITAIHTSDAFSQATYAGFDFTNSWYLVDGSTRPFLRSEYSTTISNAHQLQLMAMDLSASYTLGANLDLSDTKQAAQMWNGTTGFSPIGRYSGAFTGAFDGGGHTIANLFIDSAGGVGLFGVAGAGSSIRDVGLVGGSVTAIGGDAGSLVGYNSGTIENVYATTAVTGTGNVGGLVGYNDERGSISTAYAAGNVNENGSFGSAGGFVGENDGTITNAYATGAVSADIAGVAGGFASSNLGTITNAYATGAVSSGAMVGGFVGDNVGRIVDSFWDKDTTGQSLGIGDNENAGDVSLSGLTTADFQDTASFMTSADGWNFNTTWAPPSDGYYPVLYALSPVAWVSAVKTTSTYGDNTASMSSTSAGGPAAYLFGPSGDGLGLGDGTVTVDPTTNAGTHTTDIAARNDTLTSDGGVSYRVFYYGQDGNSVVVDKATLTVTANDASKTYDGEAWSGGNGVSYSGFVNGEDASALGGTLAYDGTAQGAANVGSYGISASGLTSGNYDISYVDATLTVNKAALVVTANDGSKTYDGLGWSGGNGVSYSGLVGSDEASDLGGTLTYGGTAQGAVDVGSYGISASGLTSGNYDISYVDGTLTVNKAAPAVITNDASTGNQPTSTATTNPSTVTTNPSTVTATPSNTSAAIFLPYVGFSNGWQPVGQMAISYDPGVLGGQQPSMLVEDAQLSGALCVLGEVTVVCSAH